MESYCMTLKEASEYSKIGIHRLRRIVSSDDCPFVIRVGTNKKLIKKEEFKEWLKNQDAV